MLLGLNGDLRIEEGRGYRDGFAGREPEPLTGRPPVPDSLKSDKRPRSIRLSDAHWAKFQQLGVGWLEDAIDRESTM